MNSRIVWFVAKTVHVIILMQLAEPDRINTRHWWETLTSSFLCLAGVTTIVSDFLGGPIRGCGPCGPVA